MLLESSDFSEAYMAKDMTTMHWGKFLWGFRVLEVFKKKAKTTRQEKLMVQRKSDSGNYKKKSWMRQKKKQ